MASWCFRFLALCSCWAPRWAIPRSKSISVLKIYSASKDDALSEHNYANPE